MSSTITETQSKTIQEIMEKIQMVEEKYYTGHNHKRISEQTSEIPKNNEYLYVPGFIQSFLDEIILCKNYPYSFLMSDKISTDQIGLCEYTKKIINNIQTLGTISIAFGKKDLSDFVKKFQLNFKKKETEWRKIMGNLFHISEELDTDYATYQYFGIKTHLMIAISNIALSYIIPGPNIDKFTREKNIDDMIGTFINTLPKNMRLIHKLLQAIEKLDVDHLNFLVKKSDIEAKIDAIKKNIKKDDEQKIIDTDHLNKEIEIYFKELNVLEKNIELAIKTKKESGQTILFSIKSNLNILKFNFADSPDYQYLAKFSSFALENS